MLPGEIKRLRNIARWTMVMVRANQIIEAGSHKRFSSRVVEAQRRRTQALEHLKRLGPWPVFTEEAHHDASVD